MKRFLCLVLIFCWVPCYGYGETEVLPTAPVKVIVKKHPKTGRPYVKIVSADSAEVSDASPGDLLPEVTRPDYRLLDPDVKSGEIPYAGPVSDRRKVYILAAGLATVGTVSGIAAAAAIPATTAAGSAGGAGAYGAAGAAVATGTLSTAWLKTSPDPGQDDFILKAESQTVDPEDLDPAESRAR